MAAAGPGIPTGAGAGASLGDDPPPTHTTRDVSRRAIRRLLLPRRRIGARSPAEPLRPERGAAGVDHDTPPELVAGRPEAEQRAAEVPPGPAVGVARQPSRHLGRGRASGADRHGPIADCAEVAWPAESQRRDGSSHSLGLLSGRRRRYEQLSLRRGLRRRPRGAAQRLLARRHSAASPNHLHLTITSNEPWQPLVTEDWNEVEPHPTRRLAAKYRLRWS